MIRSAFIIALCFSTISLVHAACRCSASGDPHIRMCDKTTRYDYQSTGIYSMFKTDEVEVQCEFVYPTDDSGAITNEKSYTFVDSCRISINMDGCDFTMSSVSIKNNTSLTMLGETMSIDEAKVFAAKEDVMPAGVSLEFEEHTLKLQIESSQGRILLNIRPWSFWVDAPSSHTCTGMCGSCSDPMPDVSSESLPTFVAPFTITQSTAIGSGSMCMSANATINATAASESIGSDAVYQVPIPDITDSSTVVQDPVFESEAVMKACLQQCMAGQSEDALNDLLFAGVVEDCMYDKSLGPDNTRMAQASLMIYEVMQADVLSELQNPVVSSRGSANLLASNSSTTLNEAAGNSSNSSLIDAAKNASNSSSSQYLTLDYSLVLTQSVTKTPFQIPLGSGVTYALTTFKMMVPCVTLNEALQPRAKVFSSNGKRISNSDISASLLGSSFTPASSATSKLSNDSAVNSIADNAVSIAKVFYFDAKNNSFMNIENDKKNDVEASIVAAKKDASNTIANSNSKQNRANTRSNLSVSPSTTFVGNKAAKNDRNINVFGSTDTPLFVPASSSSGAQLTSDQQSSKASAQWPQSMAQPKRRTQKQQRISADTTSAMSGTNMNVQSDSAVKTPVQISASAPLPSPLNARQRQTNARTTGQADAQRRANNEQQKQRAMRSAALRRQKARDAQLGGDRAMRNKSSGKRSSQFWPTTKQTQKAASSTSVTPASTQSSQSTQANKSKKGKARIVMPEKIKSFLPSRVGAMTQSQQSKLPMVVSEGNSVKESRQNSAASSLQTDSTSSKLQKTKPVSSQKASGFREVFPTKSQQLIKQWKKNESSAQQPVRQKSSSAKSAIKQWPFKPLPTPARVVKKKKVSLRKPQKSQQQQKSGNSLPYSSPKELQKGLKQKKASGKQRTKAKTNTISSQKKRKIVPK